MQSLLKKWEIDQKIEDFKLNSEMLFYNLLAVMRPEVYFKVVEKETKEAEKVQWVVPTSKEEYYQMISQLKVEDINEEGEW